MERVERPDIWDRPGSPVSFAAVEGVGEGVALVLAEVVGNW